MFIRRLVILLAAAAAMSASAYAEDISRNEDFFICAPVIRCEGKRTDVLEAGKNCGTLEISLSAEKNRSSAYAELTAAAAYYSGGMLVKAAAARGVSTENVTDFVCTLNDITPSEGDVIKIFVWNGVQKPYAQVYTVNTEPSAKDSEQKDMETIRARIEKDSGLYSTTANPSGILAKLGSDGKFTDVNYSDTSKSTWSPSVVMTNAATMCSAYFSEGNKYYMDENLKAAIDSVLSDWAKNKYKSTNWWFNEIDTPKKLSQVLLYPFDEAEPYLAELKELAMLGMPYVDETKVHKTGDTGGNLTDKLQIAVKIAAATGNADAMRSVVTYLLDSELSVFPKNSEGIMGDYSFHQHNSFFYNGSYGNVFCTGVNKLLGYLSGTDFMVSERALNTYADFIIDGHSWFFKGDQSDFSCFGRAISRKNGVTTTVKSDSKKAVEVLLAQTGIERRAELNELYAARLSSTDTSTNAAKHFYLSDITVAQRPEYYISVRNASKRNICTEYMNNENPYAAFISDGTTVIMRTGNEYKGIFPLWDWSMIPGTTTEYISPMTAMTTTYQYGNGEFVGGVSDGQNAVSVMDYKRLGTTVKKSWFIFGEGFAALGAGITDADGTKEVRTAINQCMANGAAVYRGEERGTVSAGDAPVKDAEYVLHDGIGYYFPGSESIDIQINNKSGRWYNINTSQSKDTVFGDVFTLYKSHGFAPTDDSYSYMVLPSVTESELASYVKDPNMVILSNTKAVQSVWSKNDKTAGIVFWNKGVQNYYESITLPSDVTGLDRDILMEALRDPCVVMLKKTDYGFELIVSNPKNNELKETYIGINRHLSGSGTSWDGEKTTVKIDFPQGNESGSAVTVKLYE
ncbi:MAG: polysaccharide lyase family 8 super-sandwich domain-containing protein [Clostridiales bacterium]|nr:polysaccharide lyase family 8 super-sandwich domain-containing protein [Clostridiales bacterium]